LRHQFLVSFFHDADTNHRAARELAARYPTDLVKIWMLAITGGMADSSKPTVESPTGASPYNATLVGREEINPLLRVLRVQPDGALFEFKPGQFAVLGLAGGMPRVPEADPEAEPIPADKVIRRAYSIASASLERRYAEFYITLVNSGQLTPRLFALNYGDRLFLSPKATGLFTLDRVAPSKAVILIATGTGLAPYMSMLRTLLVQDSQRRFVVLHGARYSWDLGYRAELESLARIRPNLTYLPSITRPDQDPHFRGATGRIQSLLEQGLVEETAGVVLDPAVADVFLCGNPEMIGAAKELLIARGFTPDQGKNSGTVHAEEYW
jgi:ferredoxin/flavodoxin---NADP+ reductase